MLIGDTINREKNIVNRTENLLRIPTCWRLIGWLFKRGGVELGTTEHWQRGREEDLNTGPPDYNFRALTTRPRRLLKKGEESMTWLTNATKNTRTRLTTYNHAFEKLANSSWLRECNTSSTSAKKCN